MSTKDKANEIRQAYKKLGWNSRKIGVTSQFYSMGSSIHVTLKDPTMVNYTKYKEIARSGERIHRDAYSGEILGGGNTYVSFHTSNEAEKILAEPFEKLAESLKPELKALNANSGMSIDGIDDLSILKDECRFRLYYGNEYHYVNDTLDYLALSIGKVLFENNIHPCQKKQETRKLDIGTGEYTIVEYRHTKKDRDMVVVQSGTRFERDIFKAITSQAKELGGWYSRSYKGSPAGWAFWKDDDGENKANDFIKRLSECDTGCNTGDITTPYTDKPISTVQAEKMLVTIDKQAEDKLRDRQENTYKRQSQAQSARLDGWKLQRMSSILSGWIDKPDQNKPTRKELERAASKKYKSVGYNRHIETDEYNYNDDRSVYLRSLMKSKQDIRDEQEKAEKMNKIRNMNIPGFFPTPDKLINIMLDIVGDTSKMKILEPSAGIGSIVNKLEGDVTAYEINKTLCECSDFDIQNTDFMTVKAIPEYDLVMMNPPFENNQTFTHIRHAYDFLNDGGILLSIVPKIVESYYTTRSSNRSIVKDFNNFLDNLNVEFIAVEAGSFKGKDALKQTGISVSILVIRK